MPGMMKKAIADVDEGEKAAVLGVGSAVAEEPGSLEGNLTNLGDGIPDEGTKDVEEEVSKRNLPAVDGVGGDDGGGHDAGEGGADVGAEGEGKHIVEGNDTHGREGVRVEVVMEEDCTMMVMKQPMAMLR